MRHMIIAGIAGLGILVTTAGGQRLEPKTHRLEATPSTVTYGYYWSEAKPALRIASGDVLFLAAWESRRLRNSAE